MPSGARIRANSVFGTVSDNPLAPGATTMNSNQLVLMPTVIGNHAIVTLDPLRLYGDPEIVIVTAHSAASTIATIQRGAYGTSARSHPSTTVWVHALIDEDCTEILTSATRPSDPYRGQMIFETDTNKFVARSTTDAWIDVMPLGGWVTWAPVVTQSNTPAQVVNLASFTRHGRLITAKFSVALNGAGTAANAIQMTIPTPAANAEIGGSFRYFDTGTTNHAGTIIASGTSAVRFIYDGFGNEMGNGDLTIAAGDFIHGTMIYEAAT